MDSSRDDRAVVAILESVLLRAPSQLGAFEAATIVVSPWFPFYLSMPLAAVGAGGAAERSPDARRAGEGGSHRS
jgi:hypothetical protein